jgi:NAD(P)-dependent dehydrogenase (short-subunit alcohol dehydrogenase family)
MCARSKSKGEDALASLKKEAGSSLKGSLSSLLLDVTNQDTIDAAVQKVDSQFGRLDVLINNAGACEDPKLPITGDKINEVLATNATGPAIVSQAFKPLLAKSHQQNPYSIFVTSGLGSLGMAAKVGSPTRVVTYTIYRMSKAALNMLAIQEAREYIDTGKGAKVFALCPGLVRSYLRGKTEQDVSAGGIAGDPEVSGRTILSVIEGKRDKDVGGFIHKDGTYPW